MRLSAPLEHRQSLISRLGWFFVGGALSVGLNLGPFHWLRTRCELSDAVALATSLACVTLIFSVWNYFLNFRTQAGFKECQIRYLTALGGCYLLTYALALAGIKEWGKTNALAYTIVAASQVAVAGAKFLLYHHWVYPRAIITGSPSPPSSPSLGT